MKKLVLKMMAVCAGALIVSCGSGKNMLSVSSLDGEWNITEVDGQKISTERMPFMGFPSSCINAPFMVLQPTLP